MEPWCGSISTARLGQLSSKFVVSGGDDSLVNIFRIDQSAPLLTLAGHTQRVTCAVFDPREEVVAAGSEGGALKLWNLSRSSTSSSSSSSSQASASGSSRRLKPSRSFTGHRAAIAALDFHPYGVCLASGGVDTNLKMWDLKRVGSGCFCTFKEHRAPVGCVRHSPDGKWLVSGDDDGCVHVWDLTAAKSIGTLQMPSGGAVTCFDFHPAEYYLACGGSSNVAVFDLESFSLVCETSHEAKPVTRVAFSAAGDALITASGDAIKTWKWQPSAVCIDVEHMGWRTPADFSVTADHELVAIATEATVLSVFHVDLNTMAPLNGRDEPYAAQDAPADGGAPNADGDGESARPRDAQHFVPRRRVSKFRSSGSSSGGGRRRGHVRGRSSGASASASSPTSGIVKGKSGGKRSSGGKKASNGNMMDDDELAAVVGRTWGEPPVIREGEVGHNPLESFVPPPSRFPAPARDDADIDVAVAVKQTSQASLQRARRAREEAPAAVDPRESTLIAVGNEPAGLRVSQFLPPVEEQEALHAAALEGAESHEQVDPEQVLADLLANHDQMLRALSKRKPNLQLLQMYWRQGDVKGALVELAHMHDAQCAVDFLNAAQVQLRRCLTLDLCVDLLPVLNELLKSKYERYVVTALHYVTMLAETFGQLIADTRDAATAAHNRGAGLDPNLEERLERCNACVDLLRGSRTELERLARRHGEIGVLASTAVSHVGAFL